MNREFGFGSSRVSPKGGARLFCVLTPTTSQVKSKRGSKMTRDIVMTGDRPTGPMHVGHYFGTMKKRFEMQDQYRCFFMIADYQALTTHADRSNAIESDVMRMVKDYLAAGFDPEKSVCFLQSQVPQLAELTVILSNLVTLSRLLRNPTTKQEMADLRRHPTLAFVSYPVSQAADILMMRPRYVPVGPDQRPHIELAREVATRFNQQFGELFPIPEGVYGTQFGGVDGRGKMSTSQGNTINLTDEPDRVRRKVDGMQTDPARLRRNDPGDPTVCPAFGFREAMGAGDCEEIADGCRTASIGCTECKRNLSEKFDAVLSPIREKREAYDERDVVDILSHGGSVARVTAQQTLEEVKAAIGFDYRSIR
jgi:tryptophanyl-tRNA synthetase